MFLLFLRSAYKVSRPFLPHSALVRRLGRTARKAVIFLVIFHTILSRDYECLVLFCLCAQILLYLLNYLNL